ncbi:MAG: carboxypeptidase regulatory-like domain-containing protein [Actinobacteria bacterium]|nr:carboxypeptidase regulatory-like domain-containing protein [Actinomycetota bacterium]
MRRRRISSFGVAALAALLVAVSGCASDGLGPGPSESSTSTATTSVPATAPTTTTTTTTTTTEPVAPSTTAAGPPSRHARYVVSDDEIEPEAKQLATDIAYALTTYEESDDDFLRLWPIAGGGGMLSLLEASRPLSYPTQWSRGEVVYPQMGGLTDDRTSVMVVTRQTVGSGPEPAFTVVRTLDIRLVKGESGWEFEALASAGGVFDSLDDLVLAGAVAADPRIELPDSARLDILEGGVSPILLEVMADLADITPYGVTVMHTGHPYHVFETNRVSHHSLGRAIDIYRVGDREVVDDRGANSVSEALVEWLWQNSDIIQVGSPWDVDGGPGRSFANTVHQDHIHVAVIGANDPRWVPAIGDLVWEDLDADGIRDAGEPGLAGVTVRLFDDAGREVGSILTDSNGAYSFRELSYGEYHVEVDVPSGYLVSPRNRGSDDSIDSDIDAGGVMATTLLDPREHDPSWDAGLYRKASIGDFVWADADGDGIQDPGEGGLEGVTVRLFDGTGAQVGSMVTGGDGAYAFTGLTPGTYHVEIDVPAGYVAPSRDRGSDDALDSDIDAGGTMAATTLVSGEDDTSWDAGLTRPSSIGDFVWEDADGDGIQDPGEDGLEGVTVRLFDGAGREVGSVETDEDGAYEFTGLRPGRYHLEIEFPDGYGASLQDEGTDDEVDSDIDDEGVTEEVVLAPGADDPDWDAGLVPLPPDRRSG